MRTLIVLIIFIAIAVTACGRTSEPELMPEVTIKIEQSIARGDARAVAVGLYENGQTTFIGFGQKSSSDSDLPEGNTIFEIGSITKVFTSLLTQVLVEDGTLDWDDTIADHLPGTEFASGDIATITLRELASHTSGLPRIPDNMDPQDPMNPYKGYERSHLLSFLAAYEPESLVKEYAYSNLGAGLLGEIAAHAAGMSYVEAMEELVLRPLGMNDSGMRLRADQTDRLAPGFSDGADMPNWDGFDALAGAGALLSTVDDLLHFAALNLDPKQVQASLEAIKVPQANGETGFGWHIMNMDDGGQVYWHNGGTGGYASFLAIRPDTNTAAIILSTSTDYNEITELGFTQITGQVRGGEVTNLEAYPGSYQIAEGFVLRISIEDERLMAQATGQSAIALTPSAENEFVFPAADIRIVFELGDNGSAEKLTLYQGGQVMPAPRVADDQGPQARQEITLDASALGDYTGEYQLATAAIISIVARDEQLYAQLTGQAAYPIFAYEEDRFFYKIVDAQLHFERDESGAVVAVVLRQIGEQRAPRIE